MKIWLFCCFNSLLLFVGIVQAGAGHDHGTPETPPTNIADNTPRVVMSSEQFELVGVTEDKNIHLYLDDFASNTPIQNASVELEIAGKQLKAEEEGDGTYHITLEHKLEDGVHPILATILTTTTSDLLTGELDIHTEENKADDTTQQGILITPLNLIFISMAIVVIFLLLIIVMQRDTHHRRHTS